MKFRNRFTKIVMFCYLVLILCIFVNANALDGNIGTVAPLSVDNPISSEKIIEKDLKKLETRYNDPPPEYYKGSMGPNQYDSYELKYNGQSQRPTNIVSGNYFNPYLSKHGFYGALNPKDRISIGGGYYSGSEFSGNNYAGSDRVRHYGSPQPVDIPANGYNSNGFYGGGHGYDATYDQGFDGNSWPDKMHHLSKSHLLPLAGAALIGIAAALLVNPVLLQLGTVTGKRRRRRDTTRQSTSSQPAHNLAYNAYKQQ